MDNFRVGVLQDFRRELVGDLVDDNQRFAVFAHFGKQIRERLDGRAL